MSPKFYKVGPQWWVLQSDCHPEESITVADTNQSFDLDGEEIEFNEALEALTITEPIPCPFLFAVEMEVC